MDSSESDKETGRRSTRSKKNVCYTDTEELKMLDVQIAIESGDVIVDSQEKVPKKVPKETSRTSQKLRALLAFSSDAEDGFDEEDEEEEQDDSIPEKYRKVVKESSSSDDDEDGSDEEKASQSDSNDSVVFVEATRSPCPLHSKKKESIADIETVGVKPISAQVRARAPKRKFFKTTLSSEVIDLEDPEDDYENDKPMKKPKLGFDIIKSARKKNN